MKRGTPDHPKMKALARILGIPRPHAVGIMETLWQWTANYAADGDLARWSSGQVADAVEWTDPEQLFGALKDADVRFIDDDGFVHDWPHHCEDSVHVKLARAGRYFACGCAPSVKRLKKTERENAPSPHTCARHAHGVRTDSAPPSPKPSPSPKPKAFSHAPQSDPETKSGNDLVDDGRNNDDGEVGEFWGNGSWGVIEALAAKGHLHAGYPSAMKRRLNDLIPWPFKDCVAHFVDVFKAREKPKDMSDVFGRVFWRLNNAKSPSMKNRRIVEKFMRYAHDRNGVPVPIMRAVV